MSSLSGPAVSVVVPTRNRPQTLARTLRALAAQHDAPPFEVVAVDDASTESTRIVLDRLAAELPFRLTVVRRDVQGGPGPARDTGWRASTGRMIVFTDDDCTPAPTWLSHLAAALEDADIAQGCTLPDPAERERWGPFTHTVEITSDAGFYETCNIGYQRAWLEALGGFDHSYGYYCEDTDLGWRAKAKGARVAFVPDAVVYHAVGPSDFLGHLRSVHRRTGLVHLVQRHPEARSIFPGRWYHKPTHPPALLVAGAGTLLALRPRSPARWTLAGAAMAGYTRACLRTWKSPARARQWAVVVPQALVADLAEVGVLAAASVRERTLFL